jgi:aminoglycoside phosphotransferase (APT) family kinase protein
VRDRTVVLKLARCTGQAGTEAIAKERSLLEFLATTEVPAPRIEFADVQGTEFGRAYLLMESVGDSFVEHVRCDPASAQALFQEMGRALATIHDVELSSTLAVSNASTDSASAATYWAESCQAAVELARSGVLPDDAVVQLCNAAPPRFSGRQLCHSDFNAAQCTVTDGRLRAVVDWEAAWVGNPEIDAEIARGYLDLEGDSLRIAVFESGYASRRQLPGTVLAAVRMVFLTNLLKTYRSQGEAAWQHCVRSGRVARAQSLFTGYAARLVG